MLCYTDHSLHTCYVTSTCRDEHPAYTQQQQHGTFCPLSVLIVKGWNF